MKNLTLRFSLLALLLPLFASAQKKNIGYLLSKLNPKVLVCCDDLQSNDTLLDNKNGFYEQKMAPDETSQFMLQAAQFNNADGTSLLFISYMSGDEQCTFYHTSFFEYRPKGDSLAPLKESDVLPYFSRRDLIHDTMVYHVINQHLDSIRANYLGDKAIVEDVLQEIYGFHYLLPRKGTNAQVHLSICDYIPTNAVSIPTKDWDIIEKAGQRYYQLVYDKKKKRFTLKN